VAGKAIGVINSRRERFALAREQELSNYLAKGITPVVGGSLIAEVK